jgi:ABC-type Mn2+/Zn2+ transport system permease subunit
MEWLTDPFQLAFQQRALIAGALAAAALAVVGTWVVIRGMAFLGDALVHGVVPGIALAVILDFNPLLGAAGAALVMILGINVVRARTSFAEDTGIGLLFVGMLALGVILLSTTASYTGSLTAVLFGDTLGVTRDDIRLVAVVAAVSIVASVLLHRSFLVLAFNEQKARLLGLRPRLAHFALLALVTLVIVGSFRTVGTLLVFGLLVGPPATAALVVRRVPVVMALAAGLGFTAVVGGLILSYHAGTAGSASIALVAVAMFFIVLAAREGYDRMRRPATDNSV